MTFIRVKMATVKGMAVWLPLAVKREVTGSNSVSRTPGIPILPVVLGFGSFPQSLAQMRTAIIP
jgi:hypothetical protein